MTRFKKGDRVRVTVGPSKDSPTASFAEGHPAVGVVNEVIEGHGEAFYTVDCGKHPDYWITAVESHVYPAPPPLPPAVQMAADLIRSQEIWGAWRVFLDNVWSFDLATQHRYRGLCGLVKYGFRVLDLRNAVCSVIGDDGKRPDLQCFDPEQRRSAAALAFEDHKADCDACGGPDKWARLNSMCFEGRRLLEIYNTEAKKCDEGI